MVKISAIIPYHSPRSHLEICLQGHAVDSQEIAEIIVIVNSDDPGRLPWIPTDPRVRIVHANKALGYSAAINAGARAASGSLLVLSDADVLPTAGWLKPHIEAHSASPEVGMTASRLLDSRTGRIIDSGIARTSRNFIHPQRSLTLSQASTYSDPQRVQFACSALSMVKAEAFHEAGGMDLKLQHYYQDIDFCLALDANGWETWVLPSSLGYHAGHTALRDRSPYKIDERAYISAKHAGRFHNDVHTYLRKSIATLSPTNHERAFLLLDTSTIAPLSDYTQELANSFDIEHGPAFKPKTRDCEMIFLPNHYGVEIIRSLKPIIYLVDSVASLRHNKLWSEVRRCERDIVIDRHANILRFCNMA